MSNDIPQYIKNRWIIVHDDKGNHIEKIEEMKDSLGLYLAEKDLSKIKSESGKVYKVYDKFKKAHIDLLIMERSRKYDEWNVLAGQIMGLNDEIGRLDDDINALKNINPDEF